MGLFADIVIALVIGFIYNLMIYKLEEIFGADLEYDKKIQANLMISFAGGIIGLFLALYVFNEGSKYRNRPLRYGLYFGSILLLTYSAFYNWVTMTNDTKFVVMLITLFALIIYTYDGDNGNANEKYSDDTEPFKNKIKNQNHYDDDNMTDIDRIINYLK